MCINLYNPENKNKDEYFSEEHELLKQIYTSIENEDSENARLLTQQLIDHQLKIGNSNISDLEEALNNLQ